MKGRFTKYATAIVNEELDLGKAGINFHIWSKYKKGRAKLGTLQVTAGGLRWRPNQGKKWIRKSWDQVSEWVES